MTVYSPTYRVTIAGVVQTADILSGGTITYGRNDFFEATQPSYCNIELLNLDGASPVVELLDPVIIEVTNSAGTYVKLFTGEVSGVSYPEELDGARIQRILEETLFIAWEDLSNTQTWNDFTTETWANYGVQGIDTIDSGRYEVLARTAEIQQAYILTDETQQSGLGYLYDTTDFEITLLTLIFKQDYKQQIL